MPNADYSPFDRQDPRNHLSEPLPPFRKLTAQEATDAWQAARIAELEAENERLRQWGDRLNAENDDLFHALWWNSPITAGIKRDDETPVPFLPVDPEEQRRLATKASDGQQCMIYRHGA